MTARTLAGSAVRTCGFALIGLSLLLNPWILAFLLSEDGEFGRSLRMLVWCMQAGLALAGIVMWRAHGRLGAGAARVARRYPNAVALCFGLFAFFALLLSVELGFRIYNTLNARYHPVVETVPDTLMKPGTSSHSTKRIGERILFDVTYTRDEFGARVTPASPTESTGRDLLFFGCSYTFGQGLEDDETLPNAVAKRSPGWRVVNFGNPGYGPSNVLRALESPATLDRFRGDRVELIYTFIPHHVRRTIGSMRVATAWGREHPLYLPGPGHSVIYGGTMTADRPLLSAFYRGLSRESILAYFDLDIPIRVSQRDIQHTVNVIAAARDRFVEQIDGGHFTVLLFPDRPNVEFSASEVAPLFEAAGIRTVDYAGRIQNEEDAWIPVDGHPTAKTLDRVADWLVTDLGFGNATAPGVEISKDETPGSR